MQERVSARSALPLKSVPAGSSGLKPTQKTFYTMVPFTASHCETYDRCKKVAGRRARLGASVHSVSRAVMECAVTSFSSTLVSLCLQTCEGSRLGPRGTAKGL